MENLQRICSKTNIKAQDLYNMIDSDNDLSREVLKSANRIDSNVESLENAFIILGINTIKNIVLKVSEDDKGRSS